jgi:hypothetical protein
MAVALAEVGIKSGIGLTIDTVSGSELFDETPLRFLAITPARDLDIDAPHIRIGTIEGATLDFGVSGSIGVAEAADVWLNALPRRMDH